MSLAEYVIELRKKHEELADKVEQAQKNTENQGHCHC